MPATSNERSRSIGISYELCVRSFVALECDVSMGAGRGYTRTLNCKIDHLSQKLTSQGTKPMNLRFISYFVYLSFGLSELSFKVVIGVAS
jgi:hypothetical protein